jgi:NAD(P)-dependent dehydrogenase (short-subunit alcohol dehydrogenase family)
MVWQERVTPGRFDGRTVIVSGAASGHRMGHRFPSGVKAGEGGRVIAVDISTNRLYDLVASLSNIDIVTVAGDITQQADINRIVGTAGSRIDGLANVAGVNDDFSPAHETSDAIWDRVLGINLTGAFKLARAVIPAMLAAGRGAIVNVTSEAGLRGNASGTASCAAGGPRARLGSAYRVEVLPQDRRQLLGEKVPIAFADAVLICH